MANTTQVKEITQKLEEGIQALFESDRYMEYLRTMSRFHSYSTRNTLLIHMQMPGASLVAGFGAWQKKFERHVLKGAKSIKILAPTPFTIREEKEKLDPVTRLPVLDEHGLPVMEQIEKQLARFKVVSVFDISQTDGKPIPSLAQDLTGNVEQYAAFLDALRDVSPLPIVFEALPEDTDGVCRFGDRIAIREGMSEAQTVSAVIHEMTHARLHDLIPTDGAENTAPPKDRNTEEVEAESVSYAVCQYFGIETGDNSFGYLASWSKGRELKELNASLDTIRKTAAAMIDAIDGRFQELVKERGISLVHSDELIVHSESEKQELSASTQTTGSSQLSTVNSTLSTVLLPLVYENGNLNRSGKRTKVKVEPPIGKYAVYSHNEDGTDYLYLMTASGMLIQAGEKGRLANLTEQRLDDHFSQSRDIFESQLADPKAWADFSAAAITGRIADAEAHNAPIREAREAERTRQAREIQEELKAEKEEHEQIFNANVDELAEKITNHERAYVKRDHYLDKSPLLALFDRYGVELPLATKGWVNRNLRSFQLTDNGVSMWLPQKVKASETFTNALLVLAVAIGEERAVRRDTVEAPEAEPDNLQAPAPDPSLPDHTLTAADRDAYGYTADEMLPLSAERATELFDADHTVYLLYPDGTEAMAFDREEIQSHDGLCGIDRADWEASPVRAAQLAAADSEDAPVTEPPAQDSYSQAPNSPTVAELEAEVKAGRSISLMDLSRAVNAKRKPAASKRPPTLMEQLAEGKRMAAAQRQNSQKPNDREERA